MIGLQNGSLNKEWQFAFVMLKTLLLISFTNNIVHIYWVKCSELILYIQHGMVKSVYLAYPLPSLPIMFMLGCVKFAFLVILRYIIPCWFLWSSCYAYSLVSSDSVAKCLCGKYKVLSLVMSSEKKKKSVDQICVSILGVSYLVPLVSGSYKSFYSAIWFSVIISL